MAIARRKQAGFDAGHLNEFDFTEGSSISVDGGSHITGVYSFLNTADNPGRGGFNIPATYQARAGMRYRTTSTYTQMEIFRFQTSGGTDLIDIRHETTNGTLTLYVNSSLQDTSDNNALNVSVTKHIGVDVKMDGASGWAKVYLDGELILSFEGNTGASQVGRAVWGTTLDPGSGSRYTYHDDLYVDDTSGEVTWAVVPLLEFNWVSPNGQGFYNDWVGSDGNSVDNHLLLDERPPSGADYVRSILNGDQDSCLMGTYSLSPGQEVRAVIPMSYSKRSGTVEQIKVGTRLSSIDVMGSAQTPGSSYDFLLDRQVTKPGGGSWEQADIDGFELVLESNFT